jgi:hypothetical protein
MASHAPGLVNNQTNKKWVCLHKESISQNDWDQKFCLDIGPRKGSILHQSLASFIGFQLKRNQKHFLKKPPTAHLPTGAKNPPNFGRP